MEALGYCLLKNFFSDSEIGGIRGIILEAHWRWLHENKAALDKGAINSAYLTSPRYCPDEWKRAALFQFLAQDKIVQLAAELMGGTPFFLNTQLFFNPEVEGRKPYWHRDIQYSGLPEERQKELIFKDSVLHLRIPLDDDPGLEFIPGSHKRWDTGEESDVRLENNGRKSHEDLPGAARVPHQPGDLLVFSAHVLHKGVYAGRRLSFDLVFASFMENRDSEGKYGHFPTEQMKIGIKHHRIFDLAPKKITQ